MINGNFPSFIFLCGGGYGGRDGRLGVKVESELFQFHLASRIMQRSKNTLMLLQTLTTIRIYVVYILHRPQCILQQKCKKCRQNITPVYSFHVNVCNS